MHVKILGENRAVIKGDFLQTYNMKVFLKENVLKDLTFFRQGYACHIICCYVNHLLFGCGGFGSTSFRYPLAELFLGNRVHRGKGCCSYVTLSTLGWGVGGNKLGDVSLAQRVG